MLKVKFPEILCIGVLLIGPSKHVLVHKLRQFCFQLILGKTLLQPQVGSVIIGKPILSVCLFRSGDHGHQKREVKMGLGWKIFKYPDNGQWYSIADIYYLSKGTLISKILPGGGPVDDYLARLV